MENHNDARILKRLRITALSLAIALVLLCMGGVIGLKKLNRLHKDLVETVEQLVNYHVIPKLKKLIWWKLMS